MTRKVMLNVAVVVTTNDELETIGTLENATTLHVKNCLLDQPDFEVFTIADADIVLNGSEETEID